MSLFSKALTVSFGMYNSSATDKHKVMQAVWGLASGHKAKAKGNEKEEEKEKEKEKYSNSVEIDNQGSAIQVYI